MIKRTFLLFVGFVLLIALASPQVQARKKEVRVNWRFAGTFITNIVEFDPTINFPEGDTTVTALIHGQLKGRPGKAELRSFAGRSTLLGPNGCLVNDTAGVGIRIDENPIVITFPNLSLLFAKLEDGKTGDVCLDFSTGRGEGVIPIMFIGGRGKFEGASGNAEIKFETQAVSSSGNFSGETGTIKGEIRLP